MSDQQYVVFKLNGEEYGINIMNVTEISPFEEVVKIPNVLNFVEGIINYRGHVIPIISLRKRFNIDVDELNHNTRIIVINLNNKQIGFIVDEASQTIKIDDDQIDIASNISDNVDMKYINGVGKVNERLIILINLEKVLTEEEQAEIEEFKS